MSDLVNQPSAAPTRKWWAGVLAGVIVNAAFGVLDAVWPDHPFNPYKADLIGWVTIGAMSFAAYMARNRA
jgi:predicted outer membrane lipoprotein